MAEIERLYSALIYGLRHQRFAFNFFSYLGQSFFGFMFNFFKAYVSTVSFITKELPTHVWVSSGIYTE